MTGALEDHIMSAVTQGLHTVVPTGWRITAFCQEKPLFPLIGRDVCEFVREKFLVLHFIVRSVYNRGAGAKTLESGKI